ncbi:MAG: ComEC family competence protein, partial [Mollicutes bacterium]|nr:ComEC family competence protein [Mollicutes bacterium]
MLRLKILLKSNFLYYLLIGVALVYSLLHTYVIKYQSKYDLNYQEITGTIIKINHEANKYKLEIKGKEKIIGYYYSEEDLNLQLGMKIKVNGLLYLPSNNTIPNTFNYRKYLYNHKIFYLMKIDNISVVRPNKNLIWKIKNNLNQKLDNYQETSPYLKALILGDLKNLNDNVYQEYQKNGVIHLFAISGMHLNLLSAFLFFILKKTRIKEVFKYIIIILFLIMFCLIINTTYSVYRSLIFFILLAINKIYDFGISTKNILFLTVFILIIINPLIIHDIGFQYSVITTYGLIISLKKQKSYFKNLLYSSFIAFLFSLPITLINFYEINLLTPINNLILGPLITFIIYPLAILTTIFNFFEPLFYYNLTL